MTARPGTTSEAASVLDKKDSLAIRRAFAAMPFAADTRVSRHVGWTPSTYGQPITVEELTDGLDALSEVLREHGERHRQMEAELNSFRADRAAVRRFFGTGEDS